MPRKRKLNHEQELELFEMVRKGFGNKDIAKKFGITPDTVGVYYRRTLAERTKECKSGTRVVAQRKKDQTLTFSVEGGYVGRTTVGGVEDTQTFDAANDVDATCKFDKWIEDMDAEQEFMDMVERKPVIEVRPWREVAEERQQRIDELEARVAELESKQAVDTSKPIYMLWAKGDVPKCYGAFLSVDSALSELDKLNELAKFLDKGDAFEVEEVVWR